MAKKIITFEIAESDMPDVLTFYAPKYKLDEGEESFTDEDRVAAYFAKMISDNVSMYRAREELRRLQQLSINTVDIEVSMRD